MISPIYSGSSHGFSRGVAGGAGSGVGGPCVGTADCVHNLDSIRFIVILQRCNLCSRRHQMQH